MSMPAGWYDDGSGRQRWWDGERWTEQFAPAASAAPAPSGPPAQVMSPQQGPGKKASGLGVAGFVLALLGTVLACVPTVMTFILGLVVLFAAFIVSLIAVFQKGTAKWPAVVGMVFSVLGGIVGTIVFFTVLVVSLATNSSPGTQHPSASPHPGSSQSASAEPSPEPSSTSAGRPSVEVLTRGVEDMLHQSNITEYDDRPEVYTCIAQYYYDSALPDELLQYLADGEGVGGDEGAQLESVGAEAFVKCDPEL